MKVIDNRIKKTHRESTCEKECYMFKSGSEEARKCRGDCRLDKDIEYVRGNILTALVKMGLNVDWLSTKE